MTSFLTHCTGVRGGQNTGNEPIVSHDGLHRSGIQRPKGSSLERKHTIFDALYQVNDFFVKCL